MVNTLAVMLVSPDAGMRPHERGMIEVPLQNYADLHPDQFIKGGDSIGMASVVMGVALWGFRVYQLAPKPAKKAPATIPTVNPESQRTGPLTAVPTEPTAPDVRDQLMNITKIGA